MTLAGRGKARPVLRVWHLVATGAASIVAATAAATAASRLFVLEAFVATICVVAIGFQIAFRLGRSTIRFSLLLTFAAAWIAALTAAAISTSRWSALETFAATSCVLTGGLQASFRFCAAHRSRSLAAAKRAVTRLLRIVVFAAAALIFAVVAVAATLIESGIYTFPPH